MKKLLSTACLFVTAAVAIGYLTSSAVLGQKLNSRAKQEEAIRQVLARFEEAFEKSDARICTLEFVEDADWENALGNRESGRANIEKRLAGVYKLAPQARQQIVELRIRFITSDVAVADVDMEIISTVRTESGKKLPSTRVRTTHVLKRKKGIWRVVVFRIADLRNPEGAQ